jgi:hypothetical protein
MSGTPERLGGKPRENEDDAYATFMDMPQSEWLGLLASLLGGGMLTPVEEAGFKRAVEDRQPPSAA